MLLAGRTLHILLAGIFSTTLLVVGTVQAQSRGDAPGYVTDSYGLQGSYSAIHPALPA